MYLMDHARIIPFAGIAPQLAKGVFVAAGACLIGDLQIGADSSVWFNSIVRGDVHSIRIGSRTNVQDNCVIHVTEGTAPTVIGDDITIGHRAIVHGCTIGDRCLIGMGSIIIDGAVINEDTVVAAGSVVPPGKTYPPGTLLLGAPAKVVRDLDAEEKKAVLASARHYQETAANYLPR